MIIRVTDWVYNPYKDNICLLLFAPSLAIIFNIEIDRHEDLPTKIDQLKQDIMSGKIFNYS